MDFTYSRNEKLKSRKTIDLLFSEGKSLTKFPLRLVYLKQDSSEGEKIKMGVSVSKKYFKRAVDRNYIKRVLREVYRLNKTLLLENNSGNYAIMLLYQSREILDYQELNLKAIALFTKFSEATKTPSV